jgi:peptidoglycan/xylan/chitin deacetylase (PgdA/CDA1 family)
MIGVVGIAVAGAAVAAAYAPNCPLYGRVVGRGRRDVRDVYLTFDDGPNPPATEAILETLTRYRVPATFFMVGRHVRRNPGTAWRVAQAGQDIGNHTHTHTRLHVRGPGRIRREIVSAHDAIADTTGIIPRAFRAPHGFRNPFVVPIARRQGYRVFGWTFGVWDTERPGAKEIRRRVRTRLTPGAIILLHDGDGYDPAGDRRQTAEALPGIIEDARDLGYAFAPLSGLVS